MQVGDDPGGRSGVVQQRGADLDGDRAGGIASADDARSFLAAGAVAVQVGTGLLHDPTAAARIVADLHAATPDPTID